MKTTVENCKIVKLPVVKDKRGNLSFLEKSKVLPFTLKRVYYLYDIPGGAKRGGHGHIKLQQLIIAMSGSFDVILKDGKKIKKVTLNRPYYGLYIPKMIWREIVNFSSGSVCLVIASTKYEKKDYLRKYSQFKKRKYKS